MKTDKILCTIEARMTSSRLPGKVLMPAAGKPLLQIMVERLKKSKFISEIMVATTTNATDFSVYLSAVSTFKLLQ